MRCSIRKSFFTCIFIVGSMNVIILFTIVRKNYSASKLKRMSRYLFREVYDLNFWQDEDYINDDAWCDWHQNRLKNDRLFAEVFKTIRSTKTFEECTKRNPKLVLCVLSHPSRQEFRRAIRSTWANESLVSMDDALVLFVVGNSTDVANGLAGKEDTEEESKMFGDLVVGNFKDTTGNETLKVLWSLYYAIKSCPSVVDVYIGRDDTYVNIPHLSKHLEYQATNRRKRWRGFLRTGMQPQRDTNNPFFISREEFRDDVYPNFCSLNNGFVLPASSVRDLLFAARNETLLAFPDVYLGLVAGQSRLGAVDDRSFGSQALRPNIQVCEVRQKMSSFTYIGDHESHWKKLVDADRLKKCYVPDIDVVLSKLTDNTKYFARVLRYLHNNQTVCTDDVFVISLISSKVSNFLQRDAIRRTWGSESIFYGRKVRQLFVISKPRGSRDAKIGEKVIEEAAKYGDIIQGNFEESFQDLTLKVVLGLKWTTEFCQGAAYLYKGDDDMFVSWKNVIRFILETSDRAGKAKMSRFFLGHLVMGSPRITKPSSKYYVNESSFVGKYFPPYCSGGSYLISNDIVPELFKKSLRTPIIPIDDAYQGMLTAQIDVRPIDYTGFGVITKKEKCILQKPDTLTLHGFKTPKSLMDVWSRYQAKKECIQ